MVLRRSKIMQSKIKKLNEQETARKKNFKAMKPPFDDCGNTSL